MTASLETFIHVLRVEARSRRGASRLPCFTNDRDPDRYHLIVVKRAGASPCRLPLTPSNLEVPHNIDIQPPLRVAPTP
jgi:hypothetical protein